MGNLMTSLLNSSNALQAYSQGLQVVENDVVNASTPGYAKQTASFEALPFDLAAGLPGGVAAGPVQSSRDAFAEQNVRTQQSSLGVVQQKAGTLSQLENYFNLSSTSGLAPDMNALFNSFSSLSISPNDTTARQNVINQASLVTQNFHDIANGLASTATGTDQQTTSTVSQINQLASTISQLNTARSQDAGQSDPGIDAQMNSSLESLSQLTDFTALQQPDGTVNVYMGGQTPIVLNTQANPISIDLSSSQTKILDSQGHDITSQISGGQLRGQLDITNNLLPSYTAGLNSLAQTFADQINSTLAGGVDQNGATSTTDLFSYNATNGAAATIGVTSITPDQIAAALPSAPGGNGNALALSALGNATVVNGQTFTQSFGSLAGQVGQDSASAQADQTTSQNLLTQAQNTRQSSSGVSIDEEATRMIQFQNDYNAAAKMITTLDELTQAVINIIQ